MPLMDGITTSRKIREKDERSGSRIPIIAMTAHATKDYQQRCLESGMDGYLSKPANSQQLAAAIAHLISRSGVTLPKSSVSSSTPTAWDVEKARARLGGDESLLDEIVELFLEENPKQLASLKQAITEADSEMIERIAHTLKGELACLEITAGAARAGELEEMARNGCLEKVSAPLAALEAEVAAVVAAMNSLRGLKHSSTSAKDLTCVGSPNVTESE